MDAYGHLLRRPHMAARLGLTRRAGEPVLFNDHLTSSLAHLLRREHGLLPLTATADWETTCTGSRPAIDRGDTPARQPRTRARVLLGPARRRDPLPALPPFDV